MFVAITGWQSVFGVKFGCERVGAANGWLAGREFQRWGSVQVDSERCWPKKCGCTGRYCLYDSVRSRFALGRVDGLDREARCYLCDWSGSFNTEA